MSDDAGGLTFLPWSDGDLDLLRRINAPEMMQHLGGPESEEKLLARHARYVGLDASSSADMWRLELGGVAIGSIGLWEAEWKGVPVWETGWSILPEVQGRGHAGAAAREVVRRARADGRHEWLYAFPGIDNVGSNRVCERAGFDLIAEDEVEFPRGSVMRAFVWRIRVDG